MRKILYIIPLFIFAFTFTGGPSSGWYQQFMPDLGGRQLQDITFLDSLTGYGITTRLSVTDSSLVLKTTNGGDNWQIIHSDSGYIYKKIQFLNHNTGYVGGTHLSKTTNGGNNWITVSSSLFMEDIYIINEDTMWYVNPSSLAGGVFRTTNGGLNWEQQLNLGSLNPEKIYMYNERIGFIGRDGGSPYTRKTTNGGVNWNIIVNNGFTDMHFTDSLKGWKCGASVDSIQATTDGGNTWFKQSFFHSGGFFNQNAIISFSFIGNDTIWGVGARGITSVGTRALIYKSTNGGQNWGYQLPDSINITIFQYQHINFVNRLNGWAFTGSRGVHTLTGGDTTIYLDVHQIGNEIPVEYRLFQNYPNPFNPKTTIRYSLKKSAEVKLSIYDISGKHLTDIAKRKQTPGTYEADFPGAIYSSGIYFYALIIDGSIIDTKKMILVK